MAKLETIPLDNPNADSDRVVDILYWLPRVHAYMNTTELYVCVVHVPHTHIIHNTHAHTTTTIATTTKA